MGRVRILILLATVASSASDDVGCMLQRQAHRGQLMPNDVAVENMHYRKDCHLGSSFRLDRGCVSRAVVELDDCGEELVACKREKPETKSEEFSQKITDRKSQEETIKAAVEATGGGWGVSVSAGVDHMSKHTSATTSVSFTLGKAKQVRNRYIDYARTLKLAPEARAKLEKDPVEFLNFYGGYFVESIMDGGSFAGTATVISQNTASTESLGIFASLDYSGFFDASFKASFEDAKEESSSSARVEVTSVSVGGQSETEDEEEEEGGLTELNEKFEKWDSTVQASPVPLSMSLQPWITLAVVSDFLNKQNQSIVDLFNNGVSQEIVEALTTETWSTQSLRQDLKSLEARHTKIGCGTQTAYGVRAWEEEKRKLSDAVSAHFLALELLKFGDIMTLQAGIQHGNWSFFTASRDDGSLRKDMALLEARCYAASTSYEGKMPTQMRPQHLKFQNSLLPESFDGTFLMMGMQVTVGGHCAAGQANALKSAQLLGQSVLDIEVKSILGRSELILSLTTPKIESFGTCPTGTFVDLVEVSFDKLSDDCAADGSLIKAITLYCRGLPLGNYSAVEKRAASVWKDVQNPRASTFVGLQCEDGYLASSMKMTPSGTCLNRCDGDGAVIYKISLECTPLCNFNPDSKCPS